MANDNEIKKSDTLDEGRKKVNEVLGTMTTEDEEWSDSDKAMRMAYRDEEGYPKPPEVTKTGRVKTDRHYVVDVLKKQKGVFSSEYNSTSAPRAFRKYNGDVYNEGWYVSDNSQGIDDVNDILPTYVDIDLDRGVSVDKITMYGEDTSTAVKEFVFQGSHDGEFWVDLYSGELKNNGSYQSFDISNDIDFIKYRFLIISNHNTKTSVRLQGVSLYTSSKIMKNNILKEGAIRVGMMSDKIAPFNSSKIMLAFSTRTNWMDGDIHLSFKHYVEGMGWLDWRNPSNGRLVTLDMNTREHSVFGPFQNFPSLDGGKIVTEFDRGKGIEFKDYSSNIKDNDIDIKKAFDFDTETNLIIDLGQDEIEGTWVSMDYEEPINVKTISMWGREGTSTIKDFKLQGSNVSLDASDDKWENLLESQLPNDGRLHNMHVSGSDSYRYFRIVIESNHGADTVTLMHDVRLYDTSNPYIDYQIREVD